MTHICEVEDVPVKWPSYFEGNLVSEKLTPKSKSEMEIQNGISAEL